ncbi:MAG: xanthine dehydrogenase [Gammaproteobacteria bacterium]|nr:xanthine dehydrogenase [Gammaproteobacteria bacterium]
MKRAVFDRLQRLRRDKVPVLLVTALSGARQSLCDAHFEVVAGDALPEGIEDTLAEALVSDRSRTVTRAGTQVFVQVFNPPLRMCLVGAVHIAQRLAPMAALTGYDVVVIDPRRSFAADHRFPAVAMHKVWPDDGLRELKPDARTAIVTLTHDPKLDDPALAVALATDAFYIGSLGSKKTHAARLARLKERGFDDAALRRIHAPVGLNIGARSPAEIAVSVLAQVTQCLRGGTRP